MAPAAFEATQVYVPAWLGLAESMDSRLFLFVVVTDIRWLSSTGILFNAQLISSGESPLTTVQTADTESPQFTALSAISNGAMRGDTVGDVTTTLDGYIG